MKLSLLIATIATYATARKYKNPPESMMGEFSVRWTMENDKKVGSHALTATEIDGLPKICRRDAVKFDFYCHQYNVGQDSEKSPRYANYMEDSNGDGLETCDVWTQDEEQLLCLGQSCLFEYCICKRD